MKRLNILILFLCLLISGCTKEIELQDGFEVIRNYGDSHWLIGPDGYGFIFPNVTNAVDDEKFILGLRERETPPYSPANGVEDQPYGYFIYNKMTEELVMGLSKDELAELSEERGIELRLD